MCKETKKFQGNKKCATGTKNVPISQNEDYKDPMGAKCYLLSHIMALNYRVCRVCLVWPFVVLYGLAVAFHDHRIVWPSVIFCGLVWPFNGLTWSFMAEYRLFSRS